MILEFHVLHRLGRSEKMGTVEFTPVISQMGARIIGMISL